MGRGAKIMRPVFFVLGFSLKEVRASFSSLAAGAQMREGEEHH